MFYAHSLQGRPHSEWHTLKDHLFQTGLLAQVRGGKFGGGEAARVAGLLHDLGKYSRAFQARLDGDPARVDHSTAGAQEIGNLIPKSQAMLGELISYAIAGHHAGLPDMRGEGGALADRLRQSIEPLDIAWKDELALEAGPLFPPDFNAARGDRAKAAFQLSFLTRMIFSCLVDADYRDTEAFFMAAEGTISERDWPNLPNQIDRLLAALKRHMDALGETSQKSPVNLLRDEIFQHVRAGATQKPGLFSLTVPTGGGKTLASLGFALEHARRHGLERIIYVIPFTSIIDQTAAIFRSILGEGIVLEHHASIDEEKIGCRESTDKLKLAMEDWAAPVIVTTNVQFFESLFSNRPSKCRKLHNLARSVIILDEAQTIPLPVLRPCVAVLEELARNYFASIVLCTATQPALSAPDFVGGFESGAVRELAPDPPRLQQALKRVQVHHVGVLRDEDVIGQMADSDQGLVIVNSRAHALSLFRAAQAAGLEGLIHLTTRQYATHRRRILADVRDRLKTGLPCRLVATSLVEAGVDLDFPRVWRAEAGLDSIAQAAGRCNREGRGEAAQSLVSVFKPVDHPGAPELRQLAGDMNRVATCHEDLLSLEAMEAYFKEVYWRKGPGQLDAKDVLSSFKADRSGTDFAFRSVAERFRLIESGMVPVIIPLEDEVSEALRHLEMPGVRPGGIARRLQGFIVQVPPRARQMLVAAEHASPLREPEFGDQFVVLTSKDKYQADVGLIWENAEFLSVEGLIL